MILSNEEKLLLAQLKETNPETYQLFRRIMDTCESDISSASHDLCNLIAVSYSTLQLLEMKCPELSSLPLWANLGTSTHNIIDYMQSTRSFRYSSQKKPVAMDSADLLWNLPDYIEDFFEELGNIPQRHYDLEYDAFLPTITADPDRIKSALLAILRNAVEATAENDIIHINAHADNHTLSIAVTDSGCGITPQDLPNVTTPFFGTKPQQAGLGLATAAQIADTHNGSLIIKAQEQGTRVIFTLPLY